MAEFRRAMGRIHRQINEGRLERALSMVESARLTYGNMPDALFLGVRAATMNQDWERADEYLARLMDLPANELQQFDYLSRWGRVLIELGQFERAEDVLKQVLDIQPYEASNVHQLMIVLLAMERTNEARTLPRRLRLADLGDLAGRIYEEFEDLTDRLGDRGYWQIAAALTAGGEPILIQDVPNVQRPSGNQDNMLLLTTDDSSVMLPEGGIPVGEMQRRMRLLHAFNRRYDQLMADDQFEAAADFVALFKDRHRSIRAPAIAAAGAFARVRAGDANAVNTLSAIVQEYPLNAAASLLLIEALLETGQFAHAADRARIFNQNHPNHSLGLLFLACALAGNDQVVDAQDVLDSLPMILQPLIVHWLSAPRPFHDPLLENPQFESWRRDYLRMGRE